MAVVACLLPVVACSMAVGACKACSTGCTKGVLNPLKLLQVTLAVSMIGAALVQSPNILISLVKITGGNQRR